MVRSQIGTQVQRRRPRTKWPTPSEVGLEFANSILEISSGAVEGAVNYVIARRFDCGGMRWIKERAEHLLQLRCIEVNGDWDAFIKFVHDRTQDRAQQERKNLSLKRTTPAPLPTYGLA